MKIVISIASVAAMLASGLAGPVDAQTFTPTRAPRVFTLSVEEIAKATGCDATLPLPNLILEGARADLNLLARLTKSKLRSERGQATIKTGVPKELVEFSTRLETNRNEVNAAIGHLSVADTGWEWTAALTQGQSAINAITERLIPPPSPVADGRQPEKVDPQDSQVEPALALFDSPEKTAVTTVREHLLKASRELSDNAKCAASARVPLTPKSASILPGAGISVGDDSEVNVKAGEFFFSNNWRLYVHSTITIEHEKEPAEEETAAEDQDDQPTADDVAASVKSALLNPYGSPLYLAAGFFRKIKTPFLNGDANDGAHGLFFDWRLGLKFVSLPEETLELVDGKTQNTPFVVTSAAVALKLPLYKEALRTESAGGLDVTLSAAINRITNASSSQLFSGSDPLIPKTVGSLHLGIGVSLPALANVAVSGTLWSNTKFDRRFLVSLNLLRDEDKAEVEPAGRR